MEKEMVEKEAVDKAVNMDVDKDGENLRIISTLTMIEEESSTRGHRRDYPNSRYDNSQGKCYNCQKFVHKEV